MAEATWKWNGDFDSEDLKGKLFADIMSPGGDLWKMFRDAYNERLRVLGPGIAEEFRLDLPTAPYDPATYTNTPWYVDYPEPVAGDDMLAWWVGLQHQVHFFLSPFYRTDSELNEFWFLSSLRFRNWGNAGTQSPQPGIPTPIGPTPFPDGGWRRRYPRTIHSLSDPGDVGQRVRFEAFIGSKRTACSYSLDPRFGEIVNTPVDEYQHSGKIFRMTDDGWELDDDQSSSVDADIDDSIIEERDHTVYGEGTGLKLPNPLSPAGDYFDGHWLNVLRNALNAMETIYGDSAGGVSWVDEFGIRHGDVTDSAGRFTAGFSSIQAGFQSQEKVGFGDTEPMLSDSWDLSTPIDGFYYPAAGRYLYGEHGGYQQSAWRRAGRLTNLSSIINPDLLPILQIKGYWVTESLNYGIDPLYSFDNLPGDPRRRIVDNGVEGFGDSTSYRTFTEVFAVNNPGPVWYPPLHDFGPSSQVGNAGFPFPTPGPTVPLTWEYGGDNYVSGYATGECVITVKFQFKYRAGTDV